MPARFSCSPFPRFGAAMLLLFIVLLSVFPLSGATSNFFFHTWQAESGLRENKIMAVLQTRDGYVWVGTYSGLARFDGVHFTLFDSGNTPEMPDCTATSLYESADGTLWIGHATGGVTCYRNGKFVPANLPVKWSGRILGIGTDEHGDIWLLNEKGSLARHKDGLVREAREGMATNLLAMTVAPQGGIWVERGGALSQLRNAELVPIELPGGSTYVQGICASADGGLWVAHDERLQKLKDNQWVMDLGPSPWTGTPFHIFIETKSGTLVAGTSDHGFFMITPEPGAPILQFSRTNGFASDWVVSLSDDREGGVWVGTGGSGLFAVRSEKVQTVSPPDSWQGRAVLSVTTTHDGAMWVGTEGAGLYRLLSNKWDNFAKAADVRNPYVWSVAEDEGGVLWAGTWGGSLYRRGDGRFSIAPGLQGWSMPMTALLPETNGGIWVGTARGLLLYQNGRPEWFRFAENEPDDVRAIVKGPDGAVWFGMFGGGLGCLKDGKISRYTRSDGLVSDFLQTLYWDRAGALWIGTAGAGLNRWKNGQFASVSRSQGLPDGVICHFEEDDNGFLWMSSHSGIIRVRKEELDRCADGSVSKINCLTYGLSDGMPTLQCSGGMHPSGCKTADGRLWFPTSKGLVVINPNNVQINRLPPPVVIESMRVDDELMFNGNITGAKLYITPGRHRFEFRFAGLSFAAPEKVQFKYRLEGSEEEWAFAGTDRSVNYSYLPPGEYIFHVTACNNDGVWNEVGAQLAFVVRPYFWQRIWFRLLGGVLMVCAGGAAVLFLTRRRMKLKLQRIEQQRAVEHERARIAQDIHDDLGAHLTRITMLSESARSELDNPAQADENLNQIYDTARELTRSMDEIVWAVNPKHDMLESLASYLEKFAQDFLATANIRCRLDFPGQFPAWPLTAEMRHNVFLAFKEALNNVVRHAQATEVRISLQVGANDFALTVEDDGRGFVVEDLGKDSPDKAVRRIERNGLNNMRQRLAHIGGKCEIVSERGVGTKVSLRLPTK